MIPKTSAEDRIRSLAKLSPLAGVMPPGAFGIPLLGAGIAPLVQQLSPGTANKMFPHLREQQQKQQRVDYMEDMPYGLAPQPMPSPVAPSAPAPMPSAMPRYQGDIMPMPDARPAQQFHPQNPKPMPKPRSPFRMDAPPQSSPTYRR